MVTHNDRLEVYTGSDYIHTHWRLEAPNPLVGRDLFVVGAFNTSAWNFSCPTTRRNRHTPTPPF